MKKFKPIISMVLAASMLLFTFGVSGLQASAAPAAPTAPTTPAVPEPEPTTYVIKYDDGYKDWRYQISDNGQWNNKSGGRELHYMKEAIIDGDLLVVEGSGPAVTIKLSVALDNITFNHGSGPVIFTSGVQNVFVLRDSVGIVNGNVENAYVYDNSIAQFNNDVDNLYLMEIKDDTQTVGVSGTVDYVEFTDSIRITLRLCSFAEGKFKLEEGKLKTDGQYYGVLPNTP